MVNKNQSKKYCHLGHISCRLVVKILCLKLLPLWSYPYQICSENTLRPTFVRPPIVTQKGRHSWGEIDLKSLVSLSPQSLKWNYRCIGVASILHFHCLFVRCFHRLTAPGEAPLCIALHVVHLVVHPLHLGEKKQWWKRLELSSLRRLPNLERDISYSIP